MTFGEKLRTLREVRGFSKTDLAAAIGFTRRSIYNWECDRNCPKSIAVLEELSHMLSVDPSYWWEDCFPVERKQRGSL